MGRQDAPVLPELVNQIPPDQTADRAYDTGKCDDVIAAQAAITLCHTYVLQAQPEVTLAISWLEGIRAKGFGGIAALPTPSMAKPTS